MELDKKIEEKETQTKQNLAKLMAQKDQFAEQEIAIMLE